MAAPSLRDRLLTRQGARAILSPVGLAAGVAVVAVALVAGVPLWAALLLGVALWAANVGRLLPRRRRRERIDPFTLQEPWRRFVQDALQARARFSEAVHRTPGGPLRDRLQDVADRMQTGVEQCWLVARRGQTLVTARRGIDLPAIERQLDQLRGGDDPRTPSSAVAESLLAQRATAVRLDTVIERAQAELRLLDVRLDEAVARTLELSAHARADAGAGVTALGADVDDVVTEMEALRLALEETSAIAAGEPAPRDIPPGGAG